MAFLLRAGFRSYLLPIDKARGWELLYRRSAGDPPSGAYPGGANNFRKGSCRALCLHHHWLRVWATGHYFHFRNRMFEASCAVCEVPRARALRVRTANYPCKVPVQDYRNNYPYWDLQYME